MKLFSKLTDYNSIVEKILEKKTFSSVAKSLLLSMLYRLEISYDDYRKVKNNSITKDSFLINILNIINEYCDNVNVVEPNSVQAQLLNKNNVIAVTNTNERSIMLYPTEIAMLYAITDIEPKYYYMNKEFLLKGVLQRILVSAYKQNTMEIINNFNTWSWEIDINKKDEFTQNIIYQNLIIIMGEEFLTEWRKNKHITKDYIEIIKEKIHSVTDNDDYFIALCRVLYVIASPYEKKIFINKIETIKKDLKTLELNKIQKENLKSNARFYLKIMKNIKSEYEELIELQKQFLIYMQKKIEKIDKPDEITKALFEIRYYQNIVFFEGVLIKNFQDIQIMLKCVQKLTIYKACNLGAIKIISMNPDDNFDIIKYILDTRIINLKEINCSVNYDDENIFIKVFDKDNFEKQGKHKFDGNKKNIVQKKNKTFKLFN